MKFKLVVLFAVVALGTFLTASCSLSANGTSINSTGAKGTVVVSIPRVNTYIAASKQYSPKGLGAKAFAYVDSIEVDFYQNGEIVKAVIVDGANYDPQTNTISASISILAGTYDKITVSVFNLAVSSTSPVVSGASNGSFEVPVNGMVDLSVPMYPCDPVALSPDIYSDSAALSQFGEKWYLFYAPSTNTKVTVKTDSGNLDAYIFGPDGKPVSGVAGTGQEDSVIFPTMANEVYYVCLISPDGSSTGMVKFASNNGSVNISFY